MLYPYNEYRLQYEIKETADRYVREAEVARVLSQIHPRRSSWLARRFYRAMQNLGHALVALGCCLGVPAQMQH